MLLIPKPAGVLANNSAENNICGTHRDLAQSASRWKYGNVSRVVRNPKMNLKRMPSRAAGDAGRVPHRQTTESE